MESILHQREQKSSLQLNIRVNTSLYPWRYFYFISCFWTTPNETNKMNNRKDSRVLNVLIESALLLLTMVMK